MMTIINLIIHLDQYMLLAIKLYHNYFYLIFALVIFAETGLVVTPFLPGDSLLFIAGAITASSMLNLKLILILVFSAAFAGDNCNYFIAKYLGKYLFRNPHSKIFRVDLLNATHSFYQRHGGKTLIMARFIPLFRTFAPFIAGIAYMNYLKFISFNLIGTLLWTTTFIMGGYFFGNILFVRHHLSAIIFMVIIISLIPIIKMFYVKIKTKI